MEIDDGKIEEVVNLGVPNILARRALEVGGGDVNSAVNAFYDGLVTNAPQPRTQQPHLGMFDPWSNTYRPTVKTTEKLERSSDISLRALKEKLKQIQVRLLTQKPLQVLPLPSNEKEYEERLLKYEETKEERKSLFLLKTLNGFFKARELYAKATGQIFFVAQHSEQQISQIFHSEYNKPRHMLNVKKLIISIRKIAECDFFLGLFNESLSLCSCIFKIQKKTGISNKILKLTYGIMGRVMMERKELNKAQEYIEKGLELHPGSGILQKAEETLEKLMRGEEFDSERIRVVDCSEVFQFITFRVRLPLGETIPEMFEVDDSDDMLEERVSYVLDEDAVKNQNLEELGITFKIQNTLSVVLWKSLIC